MKDTLNSGLIGVSNPTRDNMSLIMSNASPGKSPRSKWKLELDKKREEKLKLKLQEMEKSFHSKDPL